MGRDLRGGNENVVVVAGDAAFTCGISYEALNNAKSQTRRFIVVLNDNEWSIAKNVGAIASYLNNIVANPTYAGLHDKARRFIEAVAKAGAPSEFAHKVEEGVKELHCLPSVIFEELGLRYSDGPIDGHDIPLLTKTFEFLKGQDEPVLLHILTKKGKGYEPAIAKPDKFHGLGKFAPDTGETPAAYDANMLQYEWARPWQSSLIPIRKIVAITAAMPSGTGPPAFSRPSIRPDTSMSASRKNTRPSLPAGLATQGLETVPEAIYSTFMQRACDMIIHDIALQNLNVALCMDRAGLSGDDGPTHHGLFDIGYLRHVPNIAVHMQPEAIGMSSSTCSGRWPTTIPDRSPSVTRGVQGTGGAEDMQPKLLGNRQGGGGSEHGREVAIFGLNGNMFEVAEEAARRSSKKKASRSHSSTLGGSSRWTPARWNSSRAACEVVCTIEDHVLHNGFGCAVMEHLHTQMDQYAGGADRMARPVHRAWHDPHSAEETTWHYPQMRWWKRSWRLLKRKDRKLIRAPHRSTAMRWAGMRSIRATRF